MVRSNTLVVGEILVLVRLFLTRPLGTALIDQELGLLIHPVLMEPNPT